MDAETILFSAAKEFGFAAIAFILVYILLKQQQKEIFRQSQEILDLSKNIISANTEALTKMYAALGAHMKQKDEWMEKIKDCSHERNERLKDIENRLINRGKLK